MVRKAIRGAAENNEKLEALLPHIKNNVGLIFAKDDLSTIKKIIGENRVRDKTLIKWKTAANIELLRSLPQLRLEPSPQAMSLSHLVQLVWNLPKLLSFKP